MATREFRLSEFNTGTPPAGQPLEILCEDTRGTYVPKFACVYVEGAWIATSGTPIEATVLGWRERRT